MYDHFIAVDWAQSNMAIARMTGKSNKVEVKDVKSNVNELQFYLTTLKGRKILTFEETDTSQWLYTELKEYVDEIIVCDPYRNRLLSEGPATDKIDAKKLVRLLKCEMLKPVFHSGDEIIELRKLVSAYDDIIKAGVRLKNQRSALFHNIGLGKNEKSLPGENNNFVLTGINTALALYEEERTRYKNKFEDISKKLKVTRCLKSIPGIGPIHAVKIVARVVDPKRFKNVGHFLSYCGLIKLDMISGGKSYGRKNPRYSRMMKCVFKTATSSAIQDKCNNEIKNLYEYLITEKGDADFNARNKISRYIAKLAFGIMKNNKKYEPYRRKKCNKNKLTDE